MDGPFPEGMVENWQRIFENPSHSLDDVFNSPLCFPLQRRREMEAMLKVARSISPKTIMEIGADKGGSVYAWCKEIPTIKRMIACEVRGTPYRGEFEKAFPDIEFLWLPTFSKQACIRVQMWQPIDILFLDGDKSRYNEDFYNYLPLMSVNGIIFLHDIQDCKPILDFFTGLTKSFRKRVIIDIRESAEATDRERQGISPANSHEGWLRYWKGRSCGVGVIYLQDRK